MDLASETYRLIDGLKEFRIAGIDLTVPDGEDESLALVAADGLTKVADITVVSTEDGQRIVCTLASAVPAGTYHVRLVSHGLDPTAPLSTVLYRVAVKAGGTPPTPVDPPEITRVQSDNEPADTVNTGGAFLEVTGRNILDATEAKLYNAHGTLLDTIPMERHEERADTLRSTRSVMLDYTPEADETGKLTVTTGGGTAERAVTLVAH